jgi:hypothetical protein
LHALLALTVHEQVVLFDSNFVFSTSGAATCVVGAR